MLSIIIPTYNEEKFLPALLESINSQGFKEHEVIVSDNSSKDKTLAIARKHRCVITRGGNPASSRNNGAMKAKYENFLFIDADVILPKGFLKSFFREAIRYDYACCRVKPLSESSHHFFYYMLKNCSSYFFNPFIPHVSGQCLFMKKKMFSKLRGFDENLFLGEEHDLASRAKKSGYGKFFWNFCVYIHPRRLVKEGTYETLAKDIYSETYRLFRPADKKLYEKEYGHY